MAKKNVGPKFVSYFWPVIDVLKGLGGSARPSEVREELVRKLGISEEAQEDTLPSGFPRFDNQVAWARFYLAKAGIIDSSSRGVWTLTEKGRALIGMSHTEALELFKEVHKQFHTSRELESSPEEGDLIPPQDAETTGGTTVNKCSRFFVLYLHPDLRGSAKDFYGSLVFRK